MVGDPGKAFKGRGAAKGCDALRNQLGGWRNWRSSRSAGMVRTGCDEEGEESEEWERE
jgi:hypothetical protein